MNRSIFGARMAGDAAEEQKKLWVKYVWNLYDILDRLRAKHPNLEIESCSGGGGRVDLGIMHRTDDFLDIR